MLPFLREVEMQKDWVVLPKFIQVDSSRFDTRVEDPESTASFHLLFVVFFILNFNHWIKLSYGEKREIKRKKNFLKLLPDLFLQSLIFWWDSMGNWFRPLASSPSILTRYLRTFFFLLLLLGNCSTLKPYVHFTSDRRCWQNTRAKWEVFKVLRIYTDKNTGLWG